MTIANAAIGSTLVVVVKSPSFLSSFESFMRRPVPSAEFSLIRGPHPGVRCGVQAKDCATEIPLLGSAGAELHDDPLRREHALPRRVLPAGSQALPHCDGG